jgi:hypothetical protein
MSPRKSTLFLSYLGVFTGALILVFVHAGLERRGDSPLVRERTAMVERFGLTDLCIFTDARYTRNPAVADLSTPFQDHPMSMEHFPSASVIAPPALLRRSPDSGAAGLSWKRAQGAQSPGKGTGSR